LVEKDLGQTEPDILTLADERGNFSTRDENAKTALLTTLPQTKIHEVATKEERYEGEPHRDPNFR
jgi:hypothetical protein